MKKFEQLFKKILLRILLSIKPVNKNSQLSKSNSESSLLFIRLNRIGDALITTPLLDQVKKKLGCKIYVLADKKNHFVFLNNPSVDEVIVFDKKLKSFFGINRLIKNHNINAIIDLHDDVSTTVSFLIALAGVKYKFGLKKSNYSIYSHTVDRLDPENNHVVDRIVKLSELLSFIPDYDNLRVKYYPKEIDITEASQKLSKINPGHKILIGINISAGSYARFWGTERYRSLIGLLSDFDLNYVLFCSPSDIELAKKISNSEKIYPTSDNFSIFAAGIQNVDFLITPDTSAVHLASVKSIPVFGLYVKYKTADMIWSPYNTKFDCVVTEEPTLENMSFEQVKNKLIPFLETTLNVKANSRM